MLSVANAVSLCWWPWHGVHTGNNISRCPHVGLQKVEVSTEKLTFIFNSIISPPFPGHLPFLGGKKGLSDQISNCICILQSVFIWVHCGVYFSFVFEYYVVIWPVHSLKRVRNVVSNGRSFGTLHFCHINPILRLSDQLRLYIGTSAVQYSRKINIVINK